MRKRTEVRIPALEQRALADAEAVPDQALPTPPRNESSGKPATSGEALAARLDFLTEALRDLARRIDRFEGATLDRGEAAPLSPAGDDRARGEWLEGAQLRLRLCELLDLAQAGPGARDAVLIATLRGLLTDLGVTAITIQGDRLLAGYHAPVTPVEDDRSVKITGIARPGYLWRQEVLRAALVTVAPRR